LIVYRDFEQEHHPGAPQVAQHPSSGERSVPFGFFQFRLQGKNGFLPIDAEHPPKEDPYAESII